MHDASIPTAENSQAACMHLPRLEVAGLLLLFLFALPLQSFGMDIRIRLVDAEKRVPLEYWVKEQTLPEGGRLYWRAPSALYVDGEKAPYGRYSTGSLGIMESESQPETMDEVLDDLEGSDGKEKKEEVAIRSDRAGDIVNGIKGQIQGPWSYGKHVLQPGGIAFRMDDGKLVEGGPALVRKNSGELLLLCRPIDIGFAAQSGSLSGATVSISTGDAEILESLRLTPEKAGGSVGLRLFLPDTPAEYRVSSSFGDIEFRLEKEGLRLQKVPPEKKALVCVHGHAMTVVKLRQRAPMPGHGPLTPIGTLKPMKSPSTNLPPAPPPADRGAAAPNGATTPAMATLGGGPPQAYLFTDRNRSVYMEGERIDVSVRGYASLPEAPALRISWDGGETRVPVAMDWKADVSEAELSIDTAPLRPGAYTVQLEAGAVKSNPLTLTIAPAIAPTDLRLFAYNKWGCDTFEPALLEKAVRAGFNQITHGGGKAQGGSVWGPGNSPLSDYMEWPERPSDPDRIGPWRKDRCPPELLEVATEHDRGADYLLAHGIANIPKADGLILYFNVGDFWRHHAEDRYQVAQHLAQEWRRFPNFTGLVHCSGDGPTPANSGMVWAAGPSSYDIIHKERLQKMREALAFQAGDFKIDDDAARERFQKINDAMEGAIGFGVGMEEGVEVEGTEKQKLLWHQWLNDLYPRAFREQRAALAHMMPSPIVTCSNSWGQGAGGGMWPVTFHGATDHPVTDWHGDFGIIPFSYMTGVDLQTMGHDKRPWVSLDILKYRPFANGLKLYLQAMSRNPAGIGVLQLGAEEVAGGWGEAKEQIRQMRMLNAIGRRFGNLLMGLERRDEMAVLASFRQAALGGQAVSRLWGAHFLASKAGFQANGVTEEQVLKDPKALDGYKAVFLVDMTAPLPETLRKRLAAFQKAGGVLLATEASTVDLPGLIKVKSADLRGANEVNYHKVYGTFDPLIEPFRQAVAGKMEPFAQAETLHTHLIRSADGDLEYWTLFHDGIPGPESGRGSHFCQFLYTGVETRLGAKGEGVLYDALRRRPVETEAKDGRLWWNEDLRLLSGTFYLFSPRPFDRLRVEAPETVKRGGLLSLKAQVLDNAGTPFSGRAPVEVVVRDPAGKERYRIYRTTNTPLSLKIAVNDPAGEWSWRVAEQATGLTAEGTFTVTGAEAPPAAAPTADLIYDGPAIHESLRERPFEILLFPEQAGLLKKAETLAASLGEAGCSVSVRLISPASVRSYPMNWKEWTVEDEEIHEAVLGGDVVGFRVGGKNQFGDFRSDPPGEMAFYKHYIGSGDWVYYKNVILLDCPAVGNNPLADMVCRRTRMLPRNPSASFPPLGRGMLGYAWAPFHHGHNAIIAAGRDEKGLDDAMARLAALAKAPEPPAASPRPIYGRCRQENGAVYRAMGVAESAGTLATVEGQERESLDLLPRIWPVATGNAVVHDGRIVFRAKSRFDQKSPDFAEVDPAAETASRLRAAGKLANASMERVARSLGQQRFAETLLVDVPGGRLEPVERGLALVRPNGEVAWFYDPVPAPEIRDDVRYTPRLQNLAVARDAKRALASFHDFQKTGGYGPSLRSYLPARTVLLNLETGRELARLDRWEGRRLLLSADGSRGVILDELPSGLYGRKHANPVAESALAVIDEKGKVLLERDGAGIDQIALSDDGRLLLLSYTNARGYVSLYDIDNPQEHRIALSDTDRGIACAPDGSFGVVGYADGTVAKVRIEKGDIVSDVRRIDAPGQPVVLADNTVAVCADDGAVHFPWRETSIAYAEAPVEDLPERRAVETPGMQVPAAPSWRTPAAKRLVRVEEDALFGELALDEAQAITVTLPKPEGAAFRLVEFDYELADAGDTLTVTVEEDGRASRFLFPFAATPATAAIPVRSKGGEIQVRFEAEGGGIVKGGRLLLAALAGFRNAARVAKNPMAKSLNTPTLRIEALPGTFPTAEQVAWRFPKYNGPLPPDMKGQTAESDILTLFDGDTRRAWPLYTSSSARPAHWDPPRVRPTLRGAEVLVEFAEPVAVSGLALWEHPGNLPIRAFTVECANQVQKQKEWTKDWTGDWDLVASARDNHQYLNFFWFDESRVARYWRITVTETPALLQRFAEVELFVDAVDAPDLPADDGGAPGGMMLFE